MIKEIECYQSTNVPGKFFTSLEAAEQYELDLVRAAIDIEMSKVITSKRNCGLKRHHITDMIESLCPDYKSTVKLVEKLYSII